MEQILCYKMLFFNSVTAINCVFSPLMSKSLHAALATSCTSRGDALLLSPQRNPPPPQPHCAHIHWLISINVQQVSVVVSECHFFHMMEFSGTLFFFKHTPMSEAILSCHQKHRTSGICDLVFVKLTHQAGLMAVTAILGEVSRCSSEIFDEI